MNEFFKFLNLLRKYKLTLIIVPIITVIITFFLVRNLPDSYVSQAQIATGIVDDTQQQSIIFQELDRDKANQKFSNLIEMIKMNKVLDQVSYQLIIHDLTSSLPFKRNSTNILDLNQLAKTHAIQVYRQKYESNQALSLSVPDQKGLHDVLKSMGYDADNLRSKINIFRSGDSDFITIQFESENADLSAFVVNQLSSEFIKNYSLALKENQIRANNFLREILGEKSDSLANRMQQLKNYKIQNGVLNLSEQSKQLYSLLLEYDTKKQDAVEKTSSYAGALNEIDRKFDPKERKYVEATLSRLNQSIVDTREELSSLYDLYINNDLDPKYKNSYDSLSRKLAAQINKSSDQYINNPLNTKQELITQKLNLEIQMDISRYSINTLEHKINSLNQQFNRLVPKEADVQSLEMNIDIATKEYLDILNKYNQSSLESSFSTKMRIVQQGVPGLAQPSKKMLLVIISGIISFILCLVVLFVLYYIDNSIVTPIELANSTKTPVLGALNQMITPSIDLTVLWNSESLVPNLIEFKNQLRSIRYEIEADLKDKILVITSITPGVGKTLIALSLAFAWKMTNKKVLLIDGNFTNPSLTRASTQKKYLEDYIIGEISLTANEKLGSIDILSNKGGDTSLFELTSKEMIQSQLNSAKEIYDIIIIEVAALDNGNHAKEWMLFTQNIVAVFESGKTITTNQKKYVEYLRSSSSFIGWIMNKLNFSH